MFTPKAYDTPMCQCRGGANGHVWVCGTANPMRPNHRTLSIQWSPAFKDLLLALDGDLLDFPAGAVRNTLSSVQRQCLLNELEHIRRRLWARYELSLPTETSPTRQQALVLEGGAALLLFDMLGQYAKWLDGKTNTASNNLNQIRQLAEQLLDDENDLFELSIPMIRGLFVTLAGMLGQVPLRRDVHNHTRAKATADDVAHRAAQLMLRWNSASLTSHERLALDITAAHLHAFFGMLFDKDPAIS